MTKYRSKFERTLALQLERGKISFEYEKTTYRVTMEIGQVKCWDCGSTRILGNANYTPDFFIGDIVVEAKGKLTAKDRKKYANFVKQYPDIKYRFIFMRDNKIHRMSTTRYSDWAKSIGVPFSIGKFSSKQMKEFRNV